MDERLGTDDCKNLKDRRKPAVKQDKETAIIVGKSDAAMEPAPQNNQLMPKYRILGLKSALRLDWRRQNGQKEKQQPDHPTSLRDSITSSTQIGFSVHTPGMNEEWRIAAECAVQTGGNPVGFAGCSAGRLTLKELENCFNGKGCFGPNNTIVVGLRNAFHDVLY
jgi:hypothetical protein